MVRRLSAVDAQMHWMSAKIPNDQFLLYGFAGVPSDLEQALAAVRASGRGLPGVTTTGAGSGANHLPVVDRR